MDGIYPIVCGLTYVAVSHVMGKMVEADLHANLFAIIVPGDGLEI